MALLLQQTMLQRMGVHLTSDNAAEDGGTFDITQADSILQEIYLIAAAGSKMLIAESIK